MKIRYLSYINAPKDTSVGVADEYRPSQWRSKLEKDFMAQPGIKTLTDEINVLRTEKASAADKADATKKLHEKKQIRQDLWVDYLQGKICEKLEQAVNALPPGEIQMGSAGNDTIIVAALPEFFWRDINDNQKHIATEKINGYGKPIYSGVLNKFKTGSKLAALTSKYNNLIIFAGTVWWKDINNADHTAEKIYNSLPVFHSGSQAMLWNKQFVSHIDGLGNENKDKYYKRASNVIPNGCDDVPFLAFKGVGFGADICLDFYQYLDQVTNATITDSSLSRYLKSKNRLAEPIRVHMLIASGMSLKIFTDDNIKDHRFCADSCLLRCDAIADADKHYADIWRAADKKIVYSESAPTNPEDIIFTFPSVDL